MIAKDDAQTCPPTPRGVRELASRIWRMQVETSDVDMSRLPSERELSRLHGVNRKAVSKAISLLEQDGLVQRMARSGTFVRRTPVAETPQGESLRCINFVEAPSFASENMQWIVQEYLSGYTEALEHHEIKTRFQVCPDDLEDFESLLWPRLPQRAQGVVLVNRRAPALLNWLTERGIPFVLQCQYHYDTTGLPEHHKVYVNKAGGAFEGTRHLLGLGHRRIGFLGEVPGGRGAIPVYEGYHAALRCAGLTPDAKHVARIFTDDPAIDLAPLVDYLKRPDRPTAVITGNDYTALAVMQAARILGIEVPRDLSIVGVNDQAEAARSTPPLTTIAIPRKLFCKTAVDVLMAVAEGQTQDWQTRILDCTLMVRGTTATPGKP